MSWSIHPTIVTGQAWATSDQNTYVKGNLDTLFPYTAAQQISYSTSTASLNKATSSAAMLVLNSNSTNSALEFSYLSSIYRRQGYYSTQWLSAGGSMSGSTIFNYTSTNSMTLCGSNTIAPSTGVNPLLLSVTFPVNFKYQPIIFYNLLVSPYSGSTSFYDDLQAFGADPTTISSTGFTIKAVNWGFASPKYIISWFAFGESTGV